MNIQTFLMLQVLFVILTQQVFAASEIIDVRRNITLSDEEVPSKDFYIKIDGNNLKKNLVVKAIRKINVKDSAQKSVGDFHTVVGLLKIIHIEGPVAIARQFKLIPRDELPMLEQIGIMTGDQIDLTDSFTDNSKPSSAQKVSEKANEAASALSELREPAATEATPRLPDSIKPESIIRDI